MNITDENSMSFDEIVDTVKCLTFLDWKFEVRTLKNEFDLSGEVFVHIAHQLPDNDKGRKEKTQIVACFWCRRDALVNKETLLTRIRNGLKFSVNHEVDESLLVNGIAVYNPHESQPITQQILLDEISTLTEVKWYHRIRNALRYLRNGKIK